MRERYVVNSNDEGKFFVTDTDTGKVIKTVDWAESEVGNTVYLTHWGWKADAQVHADYLNSLEEYTVESERALGDDYLDLSLPVNGFVLHPFDGQPVCFRCLVEWVGAGEEVLNYRRYEGEPQYLCVNDCGGGKVRKWRYE